MFAISRRFWWPSMEPEVREYVEACSVCARNKSSTGTRMGLLQPLPIPSRPWSDISLDFVTGLPVSQGNTTVLTVVDRFSKMVRFIALPKLPSAKETAEIMLNHVFRIHGFPRDIVSDRGPQFISRYWKEFCKLIGAKVSLTSGYHPEANGQTERLNQQLETGLRCLVSQNPATWSKHLVWVEYAHNTLPTSATGFTPFKCVFGYEPPLFADNEPEVCLIPPLPRHLGSRKTGAHQTGRSGEKSGGPEEETRTRLPDRPESVAFCQIPKPPSSI